ncbi:MAG: alpha-keto acid decarboxylase family protein [Bacteroidales bacterium]
MKISVGDYLLKRLNEIGVDHVFGVPGDYNLSFLDQIETNKDISWVGACNELNASYAADGYARHKGAGALVTTFGVGELSASNGIAGSYAEYVPVVNIVGMPSTASQDRKDLLHHTLGEGNFHVFVDMFSKFTTTQTVLNPFNAVREIDRVLEECMAKKRPVYIGIPADIAHTQVDDNYTPLRMGHFHSDRDMIQEAVNRTSKCIFDAEKPVILVDMCALRHEEMETLIINLIETTGIPCAALPMGKGLLNETSPYYLGMYYGDYGTPGVKERVEASDCVISFGSVFSDFNTGGFTSTPARNYHIEIHSDHVRLRHSLYQQVDYREFISELSESLGTYRYDEEVKRKSTNVEFVPREGKIVQERLWTRMESFFKPNSTIIGEAGTSLFGVLNTTFPEHTKFVCQPLWASIGYTVGALLGSSVADKTRENILFIGDGSFQLTAQAISTMVRNKLCPIIFLLNNDGYTIERLIHGPERKYNDIQMWDYTSFAKSFGKEIFSAKVSTETELEEVLKSLDKHSNKLRFVEIKMEKMDAPQSLVEIGKLSAKVNQY